MFLLVLIVFVKARHALARHGEKEEHEEHNRESVFAQYSSH
jgi:hypothetical protein